MYLLKFYLPLIPPEEQMNFKLNNIPGNSVYINYEANYVVWRRRYALGDAELISYKSHFLFLSFLRLLGNTLHIYILLYKTIVVGLLEYQSSRQNSIFTLCIFIKFSYKYSWEKINELTSSHFRSYADTFRQLNNT